MRTAVSVLVLLCASAFAQVDDGSLKYDFGGGISGFFLVGIGQCGPIVECEVTFNVIAGKFWNGKLTGPIPDMPLDPQFLGPHNVHFQTGPLLSGNYEDGAEFGPGGQFHMITGDAPFLFCTADIPCTFNGHWVSSTLTRKEFSNGTHHYEFDGELLGAYFDAAVGKRVKVRAHYHQVSGEWNNLLAPPDSQQSWTGGSLDVFLGGPQG